MIQGFFGEGVIGEVNSFLGGSVKVLVKLFLHFCISFSQNRETLGWGWLGVVSGKVGGSSGSRRLCFAAAGARESGWG